MKRILITVALLAAGLLTCTPAARAGFKFHFGFGKHFGHRHFGFHGHRYFHYHRPYYGHGYGYRYYYPRTYIYYSRPYYRNYYPSYDYGCGFGYSKSYVVSPLVPAYVRSGDVYGPDAVKDFLGVDRDLGKGPLAPLPKVIEVEPEDAGPRVVDVPEEAKEIVASNEQARARAAQFVAFGDSQFGAQKYHQAAQRYRSAIETAPDVADAHFRQGLAYVASNRFDLAAAAFRRGLQLDPLWVNSSFRIDELYGRNRLAKDSHIDGLAKVALADRDDPDNFFLLGLLLHFDGQQERAKKFFEQAARLERGDTAHIDAFLVPPKPEAKDSI